MKFEIFPRSILAKDNMTKDNMIKTKTYKVVTRTMVPILETVIVTVNAPDDDTFFSLINKCLHLNDSPLEHIINRVHIHPAVLTAEMKPVGQMAVENALSFVENLETRDIIEYVHSDVKKEIVQAVEVFAYWAKPHPLIRT